MAHSVDELEKLLKAAERRAAELQAWADASDAESEELRARVTTLEADKPGDDALAAEAARLRGRVAELEAKKPTGGKEDARVAELQAWVDSSEAEAEQLRARVAELEAKKPTGGKEDDRVAELQAWVDSSEAEAEKLRAQVAELQAKKPAGGKEDARVAELQAWVDSSEAEAEKLRAQVAELQAKKPAGGKEDARVAELQAWVDSSEVEAEKLRARVAELEAKKPAGGKEDARVAELQAWVDSSEAEAEKLRAQVAELQAKKPAGGKEDARVAELQAWVDSSEVEAEKLRGQVSSLEGELSKWKEQSHTLGDADSVADENAHLRGRVAELEVLNSSLREISTRFADQVDASAQRDIQRLEGQLQEAQSTGAASRADELAESLSIAREAIATLQVERGAAVEQVRRYVEVDAQETQRSREAAERKARTEVDERDRRIASLEAQLAEKVDEASVLSVRVKAYAAAETKLQNELGLQRNRACAAEEKLGAVSSERDVLIDDKSTLEARSLDLSHKLEEAQRWLTQGETDATELQRQLDQARTAQAVAVAAVAPNSSVSRTVASPPPQPPPPPEGADGSESEGFSVQHMHRVEALLALEKVKSAALGQFMEVAERSLLRLQDELDAARGRLADLKKKFGISDAETGEALDRLDAAQRELHALRAELGKSQQPPPEEASGEDVVLADEDVLEAPLDALEAISTQQQQAAREATDALVADQRAREQLVDDLTWLKVELEKLSHVRDDLRQRIHAMVQRELKRKQVVGALLQKLRATEVAAAMRAGSLRRLQAAIELAQRTAVRVQTIYFQKQIGSLQRQLEVALLKRKAPLKLAR